MNTIFPQTAPAGHSVSGLAQAELLSELAHMTGVPAVEWLNCPNETTTGRSARLERLANVMLDLDDAVARRVAALHRRVLAEPAVVEIMDPVFGPVRELATTQVLAAVAA